MAGINISLPDSMLDQEVTIIVSNWNGNTHCIYLNDRRIAGGKPWGGSDDAGVQFTTTLREVLRAFRHLEVTGTEAA